MRNPFSRKSIVSKILERVEKAGGGLVALEQEYQRLSKLHDALSIVMFVFLGSSYALLAFYFLSPFLGYRFSFLYLAVPFCLGAALANIAEFLNEPLGHLDRQIAIGRANIDSRPPIIILRGFAAMTAMTPPIESSTKKGTIGFARRSLLPELQAAISKRGPVIAVSDGNDLRVTTRHLICVVYLRQDVWLEAVTHLCHGAQAIIVFPSDSPGLEQELMLLSSSSLLTKTLCVQRPRMDTAERGKEDDTFKVYWDKLRESYVKNGWCLPEWAEKGRIWRPQSDLSIDESWEIGDWRFELGRALTSALHTLPSEGVGCRTLLEQIRPFEQKLEALPAPERAASEIGPIWRGR